MRQCEWCSDPTRNGSATCSTAHRVARWRWLNGVTRAGGLSPEAPPWAESPLQGRMGENARSNTAGETVDTEAAAALERERDEARAAAERAQAELATATAPGPRAGSKARSGVMLSYRKAARAAGDAVTDAFEHGMTVEQARAEVELALRCALAPTQRAKLEEATRALP
jgi:hypothetical protein